MSAKAVAIGASAGAVEALSAILPRLPARYRLPVLVVVHVPPDKTSALTELFAAKCALPVREPEDKAPVEPGAIYFAPPDYHLSVERDETFSLSNEEPQLFSRPSIDVLFESAADAYGAGLIAVVLTGANHDGARGLQAVAQAGGIALVQDPAQAMAPTMPEAALAACPSAHVLPLDGVATFLQGLSAP
jgi:two-component system chemotaxis response regulator CheB